MILLDTLLIAQDTVATIKSAVPAVGTVDTVTLSRQTLDTIVKATQDKPSPTDWIQAVAAAIAAIGVVWNLIDLRRNSESQQQQISELGAIARKLELQYSFDRTKRKQDIMPYFVEEGINLGTQYIQYFHLKLKNRGHTAQNLRVEIPQGAPMSFNGFHDNLIVEKNQIVELNFKKTEVEYEATASVKFILQYEDIDRNQYYQTIIRDFSHNYKIFPPTDIDPITAPQS